ncbi:MAG: hypothetical protein JWR83_694 [Aeromicrobium sp.]|nr:hypothetical protein [Aeromicrobium sp.]
MADPGSGKPSKTRASAAFLTGFAFFGTGGTSGLARNRTAKPTPEQKRRVMWVGLLMYALAIGGAFVGAGVARNPVIGVFLGAIAGLVATGLLLGLWSACRALAHRLYR